MKIEPFIKQDGKSWNGNLYWIGVVITTDTGEKQHFSEYTIKSTAQKFAVKFNIPVPEEIVLS